MDFDSEGQEASIVDEDKVCPLELDVEEQEAGIGGEKVTWPSDLDNTTTESISSSSDVPGESLVYWCFTNLPFHVDFFDNEGEFNESLQSFYIEHSGTLVSYNLPPFTSFVTLKLVSLLLTTTLRYLI